MFLSPLRSKWSNGTKHWWYGTKTISHKLSTYWMMKEQTTIQGHYVQWQQQVSTQNQYHHRSKAMFLYYWFFHLNMLICSNTQLINKREWIYKQITNILIIMLVHLLFSIFIDTNFACLDKTQLVSSEHIFWFPNGRKPNFLRWTWKARPRVQNCRRCII